jgi:hypothetical protein
MTNNNNKNETIKATLKATKAKRKPQTCRVYELKIDQSHLNIDTKIIQYSVPITKKLRRMHRKLSKQELHSKNWNKIRIKIDKEYSNINNIKKEYMYARIGTMRIESTPVEIESSTLMSLRYFNSIPYVKASSIYKPGSFTALA